MKKKKTRLSHIGAGGEPAMVDVSHKAVTKREASARTLVRFPMDVFDDLRESDFLGPKGSIIHTAIIAGTMAAKNTSHVIPLCHPLSLSNISIDIRPLESELEIVSTVKCEGKTGVEMEALTAATIAALTVYDMCKALTHDIVIAETRLLSKKGGKHDFER